MKMWVVWGLENTLLDVTAPLADVKTPREMSGARKALHALHGRISMTLAVADEHVSGDGLREILEKVNLASFLKNGVCPSDLGYPKGSPAFMEAVLKGLKVTPDHLVWVDGDFKQVEIAIKSGFRGVWFNPRTTDNHVGERLTTVHKLEALEGVLMGWGMLSR